MSIRVRRKDLHKAETALKRAKFKFAGRQKIFVSDKFGFTKFTKNEVKTYENEGRLVKDGIWYKVVGTKGPLSRLPLFRNLDRQH